MATPICPAKEVFKLLSRGTLNSSCASRGGSPPSCHGSPQSAPSFCQIWSYGSHPSCFGGIWGTLVCMWYFFWCTCQVCWGKRDILTFCKGPSSRVQCWTGDCWVKYPRSLQFQLFQIWISLGYFLPLGWISPIPHFGWRRQTEHSLVGLITPVIAGEGTPSQWKLSGRSHCWGRIWLVI